MAVRRAVPIVADPARGPAFSWRSDGVIAGGWTSQPSPKRRLAELNAADECDSPSVAEPGLVGADSTSRKLKPVKNASADESTRQRR